ncbi:MAG: glycosyltransferase family 4 protein, partial [Thiobacillus sp.]|nr:glycosyltransferase family 4 protein [Thiobacillus sp.]
VDLLLVTAEQEAFGRTVIEAMAARVPVVATMSGGPEEIIVDGLTGFLVPVNDSQAMARRAEDILSDAALTKRLVDAAYLRVKEVFSIDAYIKKIEAIILNMTSHKAVRH